MFTSTIVNLYVTCNSPVFGGKKEYLPRLMIYKFLQIALFNIRKCQIHVAPKHEKVFNSSEHEILSAHAQFNKMLQFHVPRQVN